MSENTSEEPCIPKFTPPRTEPSKFLVITNLDPKIGSFVVYKLFKDTEPQFQYGQGLVDIFMDGNAAIVEFGTEEIAIQAVKKFHGIPFGIQNSKVELHFLAPKDVPDFNEIVNGPSLSSFLRNHEENKKVKSSTVILIQLLESQERDWADLLFEEDDLLGREPATSVACPGSGTIVAQFANPDRATNFVETCNGMYFRWRTIYAKKVADSAMEEALREEEITKSLQSPIPRKPRSGGLFARPIPKGATKQDIEVIFDGYNIDDIMILGRGYTAAVFLDKADEEKILRKFPHGIRSRGRSIMLLPFDVDNLKKSLNLDKVKQVTGSDNSGSAATAEGLAK